jgi:hypothetical protein
VEANDIFSLPDISDKVTCIDKIARFPFSLSFLCFSIIFRLFLIVDDTQEFSNLFDDHGPRGLERLSSRLHAIRRQRHLQEVKQAVFDEQARQSGSNQRNSELLAKQAEFATRKSRAFANLLGIGDAWAVAQQEREEQQIQAQAAAKANEPQGGGQEHTQEVALPAGKQPPHIHHPQGEEEETEECASNGTSTTKSEEETSSSSDSSLNS